MPGSPVLQFSRPRLHRVDLPFLQKHDIRLSFLRLDQIHPTVHGNKWFKLRLNLEAMRDSGCNRVLSFGGAFSNHLMALAGAGNLLNFETIGVVRGEIADENNPVLNYLRQQGMQLHGVTRSQYREKTRTSFINALRQRFGDFYLIPEGGSNALGVRGCEQIARYLRWQNPSQPGLVALACGTGTTLAGIVLGLAARGQSHHQVLGISVLKARGYLSGEVSRWLAQTGGQAQSLERAAHPAWRVSDNYHCGGYARTDAGLQNFLQYWATGSEIPLEPVYTGKLAWGLYQSVLDETIEAGTEIIAIHSGGLMPEMTAI